MHIPKRIIRLAKDRALASFSALAEQTVVEADAMNTRALSGASPSDVRDLNIVRGFLRGEARNLRTRLDRHFASLLERAMVTMHADHRVTTPQAIDYNTLTLVDDDVLVRQIEVERLVTRLRDAESGPLGRVNLTIAIMHDDVEGRERENPFRPYLLARALFEALRELTWEEAHSKMLYEALGQAMVNRLPGFYASILQVFESGGISARLTARPTAMSRAEREKLAWQEAAKRLASMPAPPLVEPFAFLPPGGQAPASAGAHGGHAGHGGHGGYGGQGGHGGAGGQHDVMHDPLLPRLLLLREIAQSASMGGDSVRQQDLLDLIWTMFHQPHDTLGEPRIPGLGPRSSIDEALHMVQKEIASGAEPPPPLALRDRLGEVRSDAAQARALDICTLLFESMIHDEMLAPMMQQQLRRLFVPVARAAVLEPELLHIAGHPARRLIDRLGSVGALHAPELPAPLLLEEQLDRIVDALLVNFDDDTAIFGDAEHALDRHVTAQLATIVTNSGACADAVAEAAADSARLSGAGAALSCALQPLQVDPRLADFILGTWARVLSHPGPGADAAVALLPELVWSAQEKSSPEDRSALMRMLPELVRKVREGMASIALPEAPSKAAFDRLVAVHMDVLAGKQEFARKYLTLAHFQQHFSGFAIDEQAGAEDDWLGGFELEAALARRGVTATLHARAAARLAQESDAEFLCWARPGTGFEILMDDEIHAALLVAAPAEGRAFVFAVAGSAAPVIFLVDPLLEAMEQGSLRPAENAPLFDRAVESLMAGAESLTS